MDDRLFAEHVDALYGVPREDFTAERTRRVKDLRAARHREEAVALQQQRKPTVPAWAVNQLARREPDGVAALIGAGEELRAAQRRAAGQASASGLREAARRVRALVSELRGHAADLITRSGSRPEAHLDEVEQTLFAAAIDAAQHDALRRGVFATALQGGTGFDTLADVVPEATSGAQDGGNGRTTDVAEDSAGDSAGDDRQRADERRLADEQRTRRHELEQRKDTLERARRQQGQRLGAAEAAVQDLRIRAAQAADEVEAARAALARIDQELDATAEALSEIDA